MRPVAHGTLCRLRLRKTRRPQTCCGPLSAPVPVRDARPAARHAGWLTRAGSAGGADRAVRASRLASGAVDALRGIDRVDRILLGNSPLGAALDASAAGNTLFRINLVSHRGKMLGKPGCGMQGNFREVDGLCRGAHMREAPLHHSCRVSAQPAAGSIAEG